MTESNTRCLNCKVTLVGDYCHECGQSAKVTRLKLSETIKEFFSSSFAIEGPFFRTLKYLVVNPGKLFRDYLGGMRKSYYKPVAFFIMLTAAYIIVRSLINYDSFGGNPPPTNLPENRKIFAVAAFFMVQNINNIMFFLVLSIALFQKMFYWRKYNLVEYLAVGFYLSGFYILLGVLTAIINTYIYQFSPQINLLILFAILVYSFYSLHLKNSFWSILKYLIVSVLCILGYVIMGYGFSLLFVYLKA